MALEWHRCRLVTCDVPKNQKLIPAACREQSAVATKRDSVHFRRMTAQRRAQCFAASCVPQKHSSICAARGHHPVVRAEGHTQHWRCVTAQRLTTEGFPLLDIPNNRRSIVT